MVGMKFTHNRIILFVAIAGSFVAPTQATASCAAGPPEVVWFAPQDGAVDVSVYAPIVALGSLGATITATVNEVPLGAVEPGLWRFSAIHPLELDTEYTLVITATAEDGAESVQTGTFRTESAEVPLGGAPMLPEPKTWETHTSLEHLSEVCQKAVFAVDCYDTGQDMLLSLNAEQEGATAWIVEPIGPNNTTGMRVLWPAECGPPSIYAHSGHLADESACYSLTAVGNAGILSQFTMRCGPFWDPPPTTDDVSTTDDASTTAGPDAGVTPPDNGSPSTGGGGGCASDPSANPARGMLWMVLLMMAWMWGRGGHSVQNQ